MTQDNLRAVLFHWQWEDSYCQEPAVLHRSGRGTSADTSVGACAGEAGVKRALRLMTLKVVTLLYQRFTPGCESCPDMEAESACYQEYSDLFAVHNYHKQSHETRDEENK